MNKLRQLMCVCSGDKSKYGYKLSREEREAHRRISRDLVHEGKKFRSTHRLLLLGTGESGKSTFLRQMRVICGEQFSDDELIQFKDIIYDNVYRGILFLLQARKDLNIAWQQENESTAAEEAFRESQESIKQQHRERAKAGKLLWTESEFHTLIPFISTLWSDPALRTAFKSRTRILSDNFSENAEYFLDNLDRLGSPDYVPINEDVVWSRRATKSVVEVNLTYKGRHFLNFTDVGGQSVERRRWFQLLADKAYVLFLVAASHYDEYYVDRASGETRNKLAEAVDVLLHLYAQNVLNSETTVIIFLNKYDVLQQKLAARFSNIRDHFPSFPAASDPWNLEHVKSFLSELFFAPLSELPDRCKYRHFTTAVSRDNIDSVFEIISSSVLLREMNNMMMQ